MMEHSFKILIFGIIIFCFVSDSGQTIRERLSNEPCGSDFFRCDNYRCTRLNFRCDGDNDCNDWSDETDCHKPLTEDLGYHMIRHIKEKSVEWLIRNAENATVTNDWDYTIARTAVALYLTNETYFASGNTTAGKMIARKLRLQMLDKLAQRNIEDIPTTELAVFINALLATCVNPRNFHGVDLVVELRVRTHSPAVDYAGPYALLALCNAGENMTAGDVRKLQNVFQNAKREPWSDMRAYAMMALSCASAQPHNNINMSLKADQFHGFLPGQADNGTEDNIKTTALIVQGFIAASKFPSPWKGSLQYLNFNENRALNTLIYTLKSNTTMDKVLLLYYTLPVLSYKTIGNISFSHCRQHASEETDASLELMPHIQIAYSLWFGVDKYMERTLRIRVPANAKFQTTMDIASKFDNSYRYNTFLRNGNRSIVLMSGTQEDPENDKFWFFYRVTNNLATEIINQSPFDYIPENNEHLVLWFRKAPWAIEE